MTTQQESDALMDMIVEGLASHQRQTLTRIDLPPWEAVVAISTPADVEREWQYLRINSTAFLTPGLLAERLRNLRKRRLSEAGDPPPAAVDADNLDGYRGWLRAWRKAIADGCDRDEATQSADGWAKDNGHYDPRMRSQPAALPAALMAQLRAGFPAQ